MELNELIARLERVRDGGSNGLDVENHEGGRRRVILRGQNADEFVWVEGVLESVEDLAALPDVALVARVTPEQEQEVFTRVDEDFNVTGAILTRPGESLIERVSDARVLQLVHGTMPDNQLRELAEDMHALRAVEPEYNDDFDPVPVWSKPGWPPESNPTQAQLDSPEFEAVWKVIKTWDIGSPELGPGMRTGGMGNHVVQILRALTPVVAQRIKGVGGCERTRRGYRLRGAMEVTQYKAEKPECFEAMMVLFGHTTSPEELTVAMKLYLFDLDYPRADLLMAEKLTKRAKGWK